MNARDAKTCFCPVHTFIISAPVIVLAQQTFYAYPEHEIRSHTRMSEAMPYFLVPDETAACIPPEPICMFFSAIHQSFDQGASCSIAYS